MSDNIRTVKVVEAKFIGTNGSCGFEKGKTYKLITKVDSMKRLYIEDIDCGCRHCNYTSTIPFFMNWDNIKTQLNGK